MRKHLIEAIFMQQSRRFRSQQSVRSATRHQGFVELATEVLKKRKKTLEILR